MLYSKLVAKTIVFGWAIVFCCFSSIALSQTKSAGNEIIYIACDIDSCSYAIQDTSFDEIRMFYTIHASIYHKMTFEEQKKHFHVKEGLYKPSNSKIKYIVCPKNDGFVVWSTSDDVVTWFYKQHALMGDSKEMTDEEVKKLITSVQK